MKKQNRKISYEKSGERGAAMLIAIIFFVVASVAVVIGMTGPVAREYHTATESLASAQSYFLAESAAEDAYYRFKNSLSLGASDTVTLPAGSATATIAPFGTGQKEIVATGNVQNSQRALDIKADDGTVDYDITSWAETR